MLRYAFLSAGLHIAIIVMAVVGLLNYKTDVIDIAQPLPVDLVDTIEDISKSPDPRPKAPEKEEPKEEPKKEIVPPPSQPEPTPEPEPLPEKAPEEVIPLPEPKAQSQPKEEEKIPEPTIEPPKAKPAFKKPAKSKPKKKPKAKPRDFDSILKNLTPKETKQTGGKGGALSDHLAASELDRVRKQIEGVWRLPAGVKGMHEIAIKITIYMNPDRTVRDAKLVNQALLSNPTYSILAETALRAVNEFRYTPLHLPINKYKVWKEITMEFDPRNLL
ncbi:MAG TPA: hypothetical protein DD412_03815 [Holosporales bacterium]|nr:hypothetical protein [Holosporales bacterium]